MERNTSKPKLMKSYRAEKEEEEEEEEEEELIFNP